MSLKCHKHSDLSCFNDLGYYAEFSYSVICHYYEYSTPMVCRTYYKLHVFIMPNLTSFENVTVKSETYLTLTFYDFPDSIPASILVF